MRPTARLSDAGAHADALGESVARARREVPFYVHHLDGTDGRELSELPSCTKADLAGWGAFPFQPGEMQRAARVAATSGTTGPRMFVGYSTGDWERIAAQLGRRAAAVGLGSGDVLCNTHGYGLWIGGPTLDLMAWASGATLLPVGPGSTDPLIGWLRDLPITAMSATPSFLRYLVERIERDQIDASAWTLRLGLIGGEPASAALRTHVVERLGDGFVWQELYGSTEVGGPVLGWSPPEDPFGGRLLVDTDEFVVELLHPDRDEPVAPGDIGELTVTTPYRELAPLIRYRTRDLTTALDVTDPSGYPSVSSIVGRVDDALKVRGALVYPGAIEHIVVSHCSPGTEWRVVVDRDPGALDVLTVVVEHEELDAAGLGDLLAAGIGVRCDVEVVDPKSLDRFEGKSRRVIDRRPG